MPGGLTPPLPAALYRGAVNTWECDENNHLNVRFQLERAFAGLAFMAARLEMKRAFSEQACATLLPLDLHVRFLREAHIGHVLAISGGVLAWGDQDATFCFDMRHADGAPATAFTLRAAHIEPRLLKPFPWSKRTNAAAARLKCDAPKHTKPRAIDVSRTPADASLARAQALGASRIGAHLVTPDQCDAFGRLRPEHVFGRISDSGPKFDPRSDEDVAGRISGAVVEARLVFRRWPRPGDLIEVHSALTEVAGKITRIVHWLLDPQSGKAWASVEAVVLAFDMQTRKAVDLPADFIAAHKARLIPEMTV